jgi:hypothetical protein
MGVLFFLFFSSFLKWVSFFSFFPGVLFFLFSSFWCPFLPFSSRCPFLLFSFFFGRGLTTGEYFGGLHSSVYHLSCSAPALLPPSLARS